MTTQLESSIGALFELPIAPEMLIRSVGGLEQRKIDGRWRFYLSTFSMDGRTAHAYNDHGGLTDVVITEAGFITVDGRKYGPRHWDH